MFFGRAVAAHSAHRVLYSCGVSTSITMSSLWFCAGVAPPSFLAVMSGTQLYELTSATDFLTGRAIVMIGLVAVMALLPIVFKRLLGQRLEARASQD